MYKHGKRVKDGNGNGTIGIIKNARRIYKHLTQLRVNVNDHKENFFLISKRRILLRLTAVPYCL